MKLKKFLSLLLSAAMAFTLLTATAFAAAPAEEENDLFDFLLGKKYSCRCRHRREQLHQRQQCMASFFVHSNSS